MLRHAKFIKLIFVFCLSMHYVKPIIGGLKEDKIKEAKIKKILDKPLIKSAQEIVLRTGIPETTTEGVMKKNCVCSKIYDPVCASDGKSYYNQCQMQCEAAPGSLTVLHYGNCIPY